MIAFDLDGVFVPDLVWDESQGEKLLYFRHNHMQPIFQPKGDYAIITGRPVEDKPHTIKWINDHFKRKPLMLFHENNDFKLAAQYKVKVLHEYPELDIMIESDPVQATLIRCLMNRPIRVLTFSEFINESLSAL